MVIADHELPSHSQVPNAEGVHLLLKTVRCLPTSYAMNLGNPNTPDELSCAHWEPFQVQVVLMVLFDGSPATTTSTLRAWSKAITGWTLAITGVGSTVPGNQFEPSNSNAMVFTLGPTI